jgi:hypothetical protein
MLMTAGQLIRYSSFPPSLHPQQGISDISATKIVRNVSTITVIFSGIMEFSFLRGRRRGKRRGTSAIRSPALISQFTDGPSPYLTMEESNAILRRRGASIRWDVSAKPARGRQPAGSKRRLPCDPRAYRRNALL